MPEQQGFQVEAATLLERIRQSRQVADTDLQKFKRRSGALTYSSVACSALATLVAGFAAAGGPPVGEGTLAWQVTCGVVACFTAGAGVLSGVQQTGDIAGEVAKASGYVSRLAGLELGLTLIGREPALVAKEYEELLLQHPHLYVSKH